MSGLHNGRTGAEVDAGPVIASEEAPIYAEHTLDDLESRIHATEHRLIMPAIKAASL